MSATPNDIQLPDGPVSCTHCEEELTANCQAITFHWSRERPFKSLVLCSRCISPVVGSLLQDWAKISGEYFIDYFDDSLERRERLIKALDHLKRNFV